MLEGSLEITLTDIFKVQMFNRIEQQFEVTINLWHFDSEYEFLRWMSEHRKGWRREDEGESWEEQALHLYQDPRGTHQGLLQGGEGEEPDPWCCRFPAPGSNSRIS